MSKLVAFLLFVLPFIVLPFGISPFETPKVFIAEAAIIVLIFLFLYKEPLPNIKQENVRIAICFFALTVLHLFLYHTNTAMWGNPYRLQGIFLFWLLLIFSLITSKLTLSRLPQWVVPVMAIVQLLAVIFIESDKEGRGIGTIGEPNALAAFAIFLLPFLLYKNSQKKALTLSALGALVLIILFSGSRSGVIALTVEILFFFLQRKSLRLAMVISCLVIISSYMLPFLQQQALFENRADVWRTAFAAGFTHPFIGWGVGNIEVGLKETARVIENNLRYQYVDSSHNILLDWWVQGGMVGIGLFVILLVLVIRNLFLRKRQREITLLLGLLVVMSFNPVSIVTLLEFWWLIGQSFSKEN